MAAGAVALGLFIAVIAGGLLAVRLYLHVMVGRWQRSRWTQLVARHRELDDELDEVWRSR
jgi:uncharacterized membrane protein affecting hemolysin expression